MNLSIFATKVRSNFPNSDQARMPRDEAVRTLGRGMGSDQGFAAGKGGRSWWPGRGQSLVRRCRDLDRSKRCGMARSSRAFWPLELGLSALQSLVEVGRLAARIPGPPVARPGGDAPRFYGGSCASACGRLPKKGAADEALGR